MKRIMIWILAIVATFSQKSFAEKIGVEDIKGITGDIQSIGEGTHTCRGAKGTGK